MIESLISNAYSFKDRFLFWLDVPRIRVTDIVEIVILAIIFYEFMVWIKKTRAWQLFKGLLIIIIFLVVAALFNMDTIIWLVSKILNFAVIAIIVVFQPELRRALESLGTRNFLRRLFSQDFFKNQEGRFSEKTTAELIKACYQMAKVKTGALIVIERDSALEQYERTGITLDSELSSQLLINIFEKNTPLHDGAVLVRGDRITSATCYLPLSDNPNLPKELGTRHRAAIGISEITDSLTIVVSEETGAVSVAYRGSISRNLTEMQLEEKIESIRKYAQKDNSEEKEAG